MCFLKVSSTTMHLFKLVQYFPSFWGAVQIPHIIGSHPTTDHLGLLVSMPHSGALLPSVELNMLFLLKLLEQNIVTWSTAAAFSKLLFPWCVWNM